MANVRGVFVVFEGIDGSGKSTTVAEIGRLLDARNIPAVILREPTEKTDASREIRRILKTAEQIDERTNTELLDLFLIDRLWDITTQIAPALAAGKAVLLDRYYLSTAAYQGRNPIDTQKIMTDYLADERIILPDLVIFLNLPVEKALARLGGRGKLEVFETEARLNRIAGRYADAIAFFRGQRPHTRFVEKTHELRGEDFAELAAGIAALHSERNP